MQKSNELSELTGFKHGPVGDVLLLDIFSKLEQVPAIVTHRMLRQTTLQRQIVEKIVYRIDYLIAHAVGEYVV
jgi:hypothetical protein